MNCHRCGLQLGPKEPVWRRWTERRDSYGDNPNALVVRPICRRCGRRASLKYVWRSRQGVLRASRTDGHERRGQARPEILRVPGISASAKKVYFYLSYIADVDGYAFPFVRTIARRTHLSKATVAHALNELEQAGLLTRAHRYSRRGGSSNVYRLSPAAQ
jgi:hypothetical protein